MMFVSGGVSGNAPLNVSVSFIGCAGRSFSKVMGKIGIQTLRFRPR